MATAYHMVHYRRFDAGETVLKGETLESLCRSALNTAPPERPPLWQRPEDRLFDIGGDDARKIFLNKVADLSSAVFGELCLAQSRDMQALLNLEPATVQLSVRPSIPVPPFQTISATAQETAYLACGSANQREAC